VLLRRQEPKAHERGFSVVAPVVFASAPGNLCIPPRNAMKKGPGSLRDLCSHNVGIAQASAPMTDFFSMNSSSPNLPNSRPLPDCL